MLRDKDGNIVRDIKKEYYHYSDNTINYLDCNKHIINKSETCLVESYNGSLRDTFARFRRKTKAFSKSIKAVENSILIFTNKELYTYNIKKYSNFGKTIVKTVINEPLEKEIEEKETIKKIKEIEKKEEKGRKYYRNKVA